MASAIASAMSGTATGSTLPCVEGQLGDARVGGGERQRGRDAADRPERAHRERSEAAERERDQQR